MTAQLPASQAGETAAAAVSPDQTTPKLLRAAPGVELLGPYEGSGFKDARYLVRRGDGQVIHLTHLLYLVVAALDGRRTVDDAAKLVSLEYGRELDSDGLLFLVETKLAPLGLVSAGDAAPPQPRANPLLAVRLHGTLLAAGAAQRVGKMLAPLFAGPAVAAVLTALVIIDVWLLRYADLGAALRQTLLTPTLILVGFVALVASAIFHEFGHAAACVRGGGRCGPIGVGLYLIWPVFYTDVTDTYRLGRRDRLRTDFGGLYFTAILALAAGLAYVATGNGLLLLLVLLLHLEGAQQLLPLVRLDGYYALGDLVGVPDLFGRVRPILLSLLPGRSADPRVNELRPRVRIVVTAWVLIVVPALAFGVGLLIAQLPTLLATTRESIEAQIALGQQAWQAGEVTSVAAAGLSIFLLALPILGIVLLAASLASRLIRRLGRPFGRTLIKTSIRVSSSDRPSEAPLSTSPPSPGAAEFHDDVMLRRRAQPPGRGWRRAVHAASGGLIRLGPSRAERERQALLDRVRTPVTGPRRVVVLSRKGGVGKTTTALMLGHTFAVHRGDRVVAVDANPDAGNLVYRVARESAKTVTSLLHDQWRIESYSDLRRYTSQAPTRLEVIASDDDPRITQRLGDFDYRLAINLLDRHFNLIVVDTGTGILDPATQGILGQADHLVVVMPPALDGARAAASTLDWLEQHGYRGLVEGAVAVVNGVRGSGLVDLDRIETHFARRCADVVRIPWDRTLEAGAQTGPDQLRAATREAYLRLAAAVAEQFAEPSRRRSREPGAMPPKVDPATPPAPSQPVGTREGAR